MTNYEKLDIMTKESGGILQTQSVVKAGIAKTVFYQYIADNELEQFARGVYASKETWKDALYLIHLRSPQAIFSHETALFLLGLTDREPLSYSVTLKTGYNPSKLKADGIKVYTIKSELYGIGVISSKTPFGHIVNTYDMERTLCDVLRSRNKIEITTMQDALKQYVRRSDKNLRKLVKYANTFHVDAILKKYLEVLL